MDIPASQADMQYLGDLLILVYLVVMCVWGLIVGNVR